MVLVIEFSDLIFIVKFKLIIVIPIDAKHVFEKIPFPLTILRLW